VELPSRLRYAAAALLGILGVGSFVAMVGIMVSHDAFAGLAIPGLFVAGLFLIAFALFVLSDLFGAWLLAAVVTGLLVLAAVSSVIDQRGRVWADPAGLAVDLIAVGMVVVIVARAIEARGSRNRGDR
jgi:hypothetical protein